MISCHRKSLRTIYSRTYFQFTLGKRIQPCIVARYAYASSSKPSSTSTTTQRLKSKAPQSSTAASSETRTKLAMFAEEARKFDERSKWMSPRTSVIVILVYLAVSFSCLGYMWSHRLYASRLMYVFPFLLNINAERAHQIALRVHKWPKPVRRILGMVNNAGKDSSTKQRVWGLPFLNPIGLAAGFDKHGECMRGVHEMGFGFCEVGTVTPHQQSGNEKPRVWRLKKDKAAIHNFGDNSVGFDCVRARLLLRIENMDTSQGLVGVNIGKDCTTSEDDAINDYILGIEKFVDVADYLVVNLDIPSNSQQARREKMQQMMTKLMAAKKRFHDAAWQTSLHSEVVQTKPPAPPLLIKIRADWNETQLQDIAAAALEARVDGMIIGNASVQRTDSYALKSKEKDLQKPGCLSGKPIFDKSTYQLRKMYQLTNGEIPLIGVGGIFCARDAYQKIKAGASLVQLYTAYTYHGPFLIRRMIREIGQYAELDGFDKLEQAVGCEVRKDLGMDPILKRMSFEEEELMSPITPLPQRSQAARIFGVLNDKYIKVTEHAT